MKYTQIIAIMSLCYSYSAMSTDFYKWTDEKGTVHYGQHKPSDAQSEVITTPTPRSTNVQNNVVVKKDAPVKKVPSTAPTAEVKKIKKDPKTCQQAKDAEMTLRSRPIVRKGGKVMTIDEKNKELETVSEAKKIHC